jgi:hypothetical protein
MATKTGDEQRIFRGDHKSHYSILPNRMLEDDISIEAKGVLAYSLSRPLNWNIRLSHLSTILKIGRDKLRRIIRELIKAGYIQRKQVRKGKLFGEMQYYIYAERAAVAHLSQTNVTSTETTATDSTSTEKPSSYKLSSSTSTESKQSKSSPIPLNPNRTAFEGQKRPGNVMRKQPENASVTQARLADRFGRGDRQVGYLMLAEIPDHEMHGLLALERSGRLSENHLVETVRRIKARLQMAKEGGRNVDIANAPRPGKH